MAAGLHFDRLLDKPHGVHVFNLTSCAKMFEIPTFDVFLILSRKADRNVHIRAQVAVLHIPVTGAKVAQDLAELADIGGGLFWAAYIGAADDFHKRDAGAVEIHKGHIRVHVVDGFACVLFHVDAFDPHAPCNARFHIDDHFALSNNRVVEL